MREVWDRGDLLTLERAFGRAITEWRFEDGEAWASEYFDAAAGGFARVYRSGWQDDFTCVAVTRDGRYCARRRIANADVCWLHATNEERERSKLTDA